MDKQSIFRRESLDRVESPEQLDAYIKVARPKVWLIMAALLVAVISVIVWSVVGSLPQTMEIKGITVGENVINCYEGVENANTNLNFYNQHSEEQFAPQFFIRAFLVNKLFIYCCPFHGIILIILCIIRTI